ncbi:MAG: hypothetical protein V1775_10985 [Bacteroidota bacterium]
MKTTEVIKPLVIKSLIIDLAAILLIFFTPALSHLLGFPVYLVEPMRLMLILAMVHSERRNAYLLALTLPLFSYAVSGHPLFYKMLLISMELTLNVWIFYFLNSKIKNVPVAMLTAIFMSKIAYYLLKAALISVALIGPGLFSTPLWIQIVTSMIFTTYAFFVLNNRKS